MTYCNEHLQVKTYEINCRLCDSLGHTTRVFICLFVCSVGLIFDLRGVFLVLFLNLVWVEVARIEGGSKGTGMSEIRDT